MDSRKLLCFSVLTLSCVIHAQTQPSDIQQLAQLNDSGQPQQAYGLAIQMLPQWEGEPAFDLQYGVAAVDSGMTSEGIFALERVLMNQPTNSYARLELARAYFAAREDDRARLEFQRVLDQNPPREVRENVLPYLDVISAREGEMRTSWSGYAELAAGYDTNINASPEDDSFFIPLLGGVATLSNNSTEDSFLRATANGGVTRPIDKQSQLFASGTLDQRSNASGEIDTTSGALQFGYNRNVEGGSVRFALQASHFRVDNEGYRNLIGATAGLRFPLSLRTNFNTSLQVSDLSYPEFANKDATLLMASAGIQHQFVASLRPTFSASFSTGKEDAKETNQASQANTERDILAASIGLRLTFSAALQLNTSLQAQQSRYVGREALFQTKREDTNVTGSANLTWRASDNWIVNLTGSAGNNDSNIPITDYSRNQISVSARYLFR